MKNTVLTASIFVLFIALMTVPPVIQAGTCPIQPDTDIVVYVETGNGGVWDVNVTWFQTFLDWWKSYNPEMNYVMLNAQDVTNNCVLSSYPNLKLYIQPGGDAYKMQKTLRQNGKDNIVNYLNDGGAYVGVCAGFYYAATDYYWQDGYYDWSYLLGLFPTVEGSIVEIQDFDVPPGYAITGVIDNVDNQKLQMVYYGGPTRGYVYTPATHPGSKILTFDVEPNGNSILAGVIDGKKLLLTVHPEAVEDIYIQGLTYEQRLENHKWLANRINEVSGMSFFVPAYDSAPPECNDGVDNDGDGYIDYPADPGCTAADDYDETVYVCSDGIDNDGDGYTDYPDDIGCDSATDNDESDPVNQCADDFETGTLSGWTLSGTGTPWQASTESTYEGTYAAMAKQTGAGDDSFMEMDVTGCGTTLSYYRKLVGMDSADDFEVSYYDSGVWTSVEHLGGNTANDASFVFKSFSLPDTATKIRFKCETGAVSEMCFVDSVILN